VLSQTDKRQGQFNQVESDCRAVSSSTEVDTGSREEKMRQIKKRNFRRFLKRQKF
jgi:hypothetical protein